MVPEAGSLPSLPDWVRYGIWWHIYPLGFVGADIRPSGPREFHGRGLDSIADWLDYTRDMGVSGLLLGPIFESSTHGYDTLDHMHVDVRLGGDAAFDRLAEACRDHGMSLVLDGVFNHVGWHHPAVQEALSGRADGPWAGLVATHPGAGGRPELDVFEGHGGLVDLNHADPRTAAYVTRVMNHWLDRGASGWRLDAAYATDPAFWRHVLPAVRAAHPHTWIFGEVIHGDYAAIVRESGMDSVTQYELWKSIRHSIQTDNFFELDWNLTRHNAFLDAFTPQTFIGNHDVTRIASEIGAHRAVLALAALMTVGGVPSVYYGDEQAYAGVKEDRLGGDDDVRPKFPRSPGELSHLGAWMYRAHQALIALRRQHPWLVNARTEKLLLENRRYRYRSASADGREAIVVELALEPGPSVTVTDPADGRTLYHYAG
ncbi:alpha-amylase family protein [Bifidobacterium avesanii]|uniref:Alpha-amylase n=1 Tax=Bifidobacterium avesanii TaxID=1798157 RepID=A0A7K3TH19_9BIFI|nr:alpha-amylase family protein [Bifidobacterium avesanii]KAB8292779.1 alpha-amylase [Bifidobacterium avesanii]NEG78387.1 alpha-amylase [Bifidobacterium avesanii]